MKSNQSYKNTKEVKLDVVIPEEDYEELLRLVFTLPSTEKQGYDVDPQKVADSVAWWIQDNDAFVLRADNKIVGALLFEEAVMWWSSKEGIHNPILYILPEYRSLKNFKLLLEAAEEYAIMKDKQLILSLVQVEDLDVKQRLLKILGYKEFGIFFKK